MRNEPVQLKSGRSFQPFSYFPNPQTGPEAELLRDLITSHSLDTLDGIVVNLEDMHFVNDRLQLRTPSLEQSSQGTKINNRILIIKPDFSSIFGVPTNRNPEAIFDLDLLPARFEDLYEEANSETNTTDQRHKKMLGLYPVLSSRDTITDIFEYQIIHRSDVITPPLVPLNTKTDFEPQLSGIDAIFQNAQDVVNEGNLAKDRDLMCAISLDPAVLDTPRQERENMIVDTLVAGEPDLIGISLTNLAEGARQANESLLRLIDKVNQQTDTPIIILNVQEFGLLTFAFGADAISTPIGKSPYFRMTQGTPPREGNYYHKEDMEYYSKPDLMTKLRRQNYTLPCDCVACDGQPPLHQIQPDVWNDARKRHFIFTKESEVSQLNETNTPIDKALLDKFGRSERPGFTKYLG